MNYYIVTVKYPKYCKHDPHNKVTDLCQVSAICTDCTGEHHSFLAKAPSIEKLKEGLAERNMKVTRIEWVEMILNEENNWVMV